MHSLTLLARVFLVLLFSKFLLSIIFILWRFLILITQVRGIFFPLLWPVFDDLVDVQLLHVIHASVPIYALDFVRLDIYPMDICSESNPLNIHIHDLLCDPGLFNYQCT